MVDDGSQKRHESAGALIAFAFSLIPFLGFVSPKSIEKIAEWFGKKYEEPDPSPDADSDIKYTRQGAEKTRIYWRFINLIVSMLISIFTALAFI